MESGLGNARPKTLIFERLLQFFYFGLIASMPLFSLRPNWLPLSAPLIFLILISMVCLFYILIQGKYYKRGILFDILIVLYLATASVSAAYSNAESANTALIKSLIYFTTYLFLKQSLVHIGLDKIFSITRNAIYAGTCFFGSLIAIAIYLNDGLGSIFSGFSYWDFTYRIFQILHVKILGSVAVDQGELVPMRNALGEVFVFYFMFCLIGLNTGRKVKMLRIISLVVNSTLVLFTFSRRALVALLASVSSLIRVRNFLSIIILASLLLTMAYLFFGVFGGENRIGSSSGQSRIEQYQIALDQLRNHYLFGVGYGEKITNAYNKEVYVHNFLISNFYMMGIFGLITASIIFIYIVKMYSKSMVKSFSQIDLEKLLIIPILGMLVGSSTEGIFTITSWIIFALLGASRGYVFATPRRTHSHRIEPIPVRAAAQ